MQSTLRHMSQLEGGTGALAKSALDTLGVEPPIHLEAVGGQARIESVAHFAVFRAAIRGADRTQFGDVEIGVAAEQRIVRPGDVIQALMTHHLPLCALERKADAAVAMIGVDAHHVRAMLGARTVWGFFETGKAEHEADQSFVRVESAQQQAAIVDGGDEHVQWHHVRFGAGPHLTLKFLDEAHIFRGFHQANAVIV